MTAEDYITTLIQQQEEKINDIKSQLGLHREKEIALRAALSEAARDKGRFERHLAAVKSNAEIPPLVNNA